MSLNFNSKKTTNKVMYKVVIEGHEWSFDEETTQNIIDDLNRLAEAAEKGYNPKQYHPAPEKKFYQPIPVTAKKIWQDHAVTVVSQDKEYRVYISSFSQRAREQAKAEAKNHGAKWTGDIDKGIVHWTFPTKKSADEFIKARKEWAANHKEKA